MKPETKLLLEKSHRSLEAATLLFKNKDYDFSASRAYYAMFYIAEGALLEKGLTFSKHAAVISGFYHHFIATKEIDQKFHQNFHRAFEDRHEGDYAFLDPFPRKEAQSLLKAAKEFVMEIEKWLLQADSH